MTKVEAAPHSFLHLISAERILEDKERLLFEKTNPWQSGFASLASLYEGLSELHRVVFLSLIALEQGELLFKENILAILMALGEVESFYSDMGGVIGYHLTALQMSQEKGEYLRVEFQKPTFVEIEENCKAVIEGLEILDKIGAIFPLGGLGDRLNLKDAKGEPLPVAWLPFGGSSLIEKMVLDVVALEFCYYKLKNCQITIPIAMMTSLARDNDFCMRREVRKRKWFLRPKESFFFFSQVLVPVITQEGKWSQSLEKGLDLHPGGHGALWRTADIKGVFTWFFKKKKSYAFIRQINNPMAAIDQAILALIGLGYKRQKIFGIAGCPRLEGAAEGIITQIKVGEGQSAITNVEYCDVEKSNFKEVLKKNPSWGCANTNLLWADLKGLLPVIRNYPLPRATFNSKALVPYIDSQGKQSYQYGGRLEAMMQNIAEFLPAPTSEELPVFVTQQSRHRVMAAIKRRYKEGESALETPEGAHWSLLQCYHELLQSRCHMRCAPYCSLEQYLQYGPSHIMTFHPALGPLWQIIGQKICGGSFGLKGRAEMQLEIAELKMENCHIEGSIIIEAKQPLGALVNGSIRFSDQAGRCVLRNVTIENGGIDEQPTNCYWQHRHARHEAFYLTLEGNAEFFAQDITFAGEHRIKVPDGMRWTAFVQDGKIKYFEEKVGSEPSWKWHYRREGDEIKLDYIEKKNNWITG